MRNCQFRLVLAARASVIALLLCAAVSRAVALERSTDPASEPTYEERWGYGKKCDVRQAGHEFEIFIPEQQDGAAVGFRAGIINEIEFGEIPYYLYQPRRGRTAENVPVLVLVHSSGLEALRYLSIFIDVAEKHRVVLLSPYFDQKHFPHWRGADDAGKCLLAMLGHAKGILPNLRIDQVFMFGHSAGGQFTHRFAMRHPRRIAKGFSSGAGNYTFAEHAKGGYELDGFLAADFVIGVGEHDTDPEGMGGSDIQGKNRVERARNFHGSLVKYAEPKGMPVKPRVMVIPGAGHSGAQTSGAAKDFFGRFELPRAIAQEDRRGGGMAAGDDFRTWTDVDGRQVVASFKSLEDGAVSLLVRHTGRLAEVPLARLRAADREIVRKLASGGERVAPVDGDLEAAPPNLSSGERVDHPGQPAPPAAEEKTEIVIPFEQWLETVDLKHSDGQIYRVQKGVMLFIRPDGTPGIRRTPEIDSETQTLTWIYGGKTASLNIRDDRKSGVQTNTSGARRNMSVTPR